MKKLFFFAAIVAAMGFAACSGSTNANTAEEDSLGLVIAGIANVEELEANVNSLEEKVKAGDAAALNEAVEAIEAELQKVIDDGETEKAAEYASQLEAFVQENAEKLQELNVNTLTLGDIIKAVKELPTTVENKAEAAADAVEADATAAKAAAEKAAKAQADAAVEAGKAKVNEAVEAGKAQVNEAVEAGKAKANEAVQDAANKANKAVGDAINEAAGKLKL